MLVHSANSDTSFRKMLSIVDSLLLFALHVSHLIDEQIVADEIRRRVMTKRSKMLGMSFVSCHLSKKDKNSEIPQKYLPIHMANILCK